MAGILEKNDDRLTDRQPITFTDWKVIVARPI
jgi:hypothetical protein